MAQTDPVLNLTTITTYPTVVIDGTAYRLVPPDALPLFDRMQLEDDGQRVASLLKDHKARPTRREAIAQLLDGLCRRVLQAPDAVQRKLTDTQRLLVVEAFLKLPRATRQPTAAPTPVANPRRGGASSRASRASTVAAPTNGAPSSPMASSGRVS